MGFYKLRGQLETKTTTPELEKMYVFSLLSELDIDGHPVSAGLQKHFLAFQYRSVAYLWRQ